MKRPLMLVSNRLPIAVRSPGEGAWEVRAASGGLITALRPVLAEYGGIWVGWAGGQVSGATLDHLLENLGDEIGCRFVPVEISEREIDGFYYGFSNGTLWPLFHDLLGQARFEEAHWESYRKVNARFADAVETALTPEQVLWVHDYQLILLGAQLRRRHVTNPLAFFLHIPFPSPDLFNRLPWRQELVRALLAYDLIGFQTHRDLRNFLSCIHHFLPDAEVESSRNTAVITRRGERCTAGAFPISIDFAEFDDAAKSRKVRRVAEFLHEEFSRGQIVLGVDRLDYTKGLLVKFRAFERALEKYPDLHREVCLLQVVVPSRADIPEYAAWKARMDQTVGEINGRFGGRGWMPLHYMYRSLTRDELLGHYRAAEVCLVTPLKDGMNLVCKEYCASCVDDRGVLVLSEFAGAATQLREGSLIVNPHDCERMADAIHEACVMPHNERRERMRKLRASIRRNDVHRWVHSFLDALEDAAPQRATPE